MFLLFSPKRYQYDVAQRSRKRGTGTPKSLECALPVTLARPLALTIGAVLHDVPWGGGACVRPGMKKCSGPRLKD